MKYYIKWKEAPEQVWLKCYRVNADIQMFRELNEIVVHFEIDGEKYTSFVPEEFVDVKRRLLSALIVADCGEGYKDYLVDIPVETLTSGVRFHVPEAEKEKLVTL